jgi:heme exporter protein C
MIHLKNHYGISSTKAKLNFLLKNFERNFRFFAPFSAACFVFFLGLAIWAIAISPNDYQQGNAVKIMYIHVPSAWMSLLIYCLMASFNISGFIWKNRFFYVISRAIAEIGCVFTLITLLTGAIWGKPIWGAWWVWDARLTSVLLLFFLYLGYMALSEAFDDEQRGLRAASILALVGFVNVPIIKFSVDWWNTLHQPASVTRLDAPAIHSSMLLPLLAMALGYTLFFVAVTLVRVRAGLIERRLAVLQQARVAGTAMPERA